MINKLKQRETPNSNQDYDIVIIGAGITGLSASIALNKKGFKILVIERSDLNTNKAGESIHPNGKRIIEKTIGSIVDFQSIKPYSGNKIRWSDGKASYQDFIFNPNGNGISVNRTDFEADLLKISKSIGNVILLNTTVVEQKGGIVLCKSLSANSDDKLVFTTRFTLYATGRNSLKNKSKKKYYDKLICFSTIINQEKLVASSNLLLIEALENGWLYCNKIPNDNYILSYFTDSDLNNETKLGQINNALGQSKEIELYENLNKIDATYDARTYWNSFLLKQDSIFIGDALYSIDPLSGYGISKNLEMIEFMTNNIQKLIDGCKMSYSEYENFNKSNFQKFELERKLIYTQVNSQYRNNNFWKRRSSS